MSAYLYTLSSPLEGRGKGRTTPALPRPIMSPLYTADGASGQGDSDWPKLRRVAYWTQGKVRRDHRTETTQEAFG